MQIEAKHYLPVMEKAGAICTFDIESSGLNADYNSTLVVSVKGFGKRTKNLMVDKFGKDKKLVIAAKKLLESYGMWITYYGKGFDIKFLNTRLAYHGIPPIEKRPHLDMYFLVRFKLKTARRSMAHISRFLAAKAQKMDVTPTDWNDASFSKKALNLLKRRCEADCVELEELYMKLKPFVENVTR